jgi:hypothetical protein
MTLIAPMSMVKAEVAGLWKGNYPTYAFTVDSGAEHE